MRACLFFKDGKFTLVWLFAGNNSDRFYTRLCEFVSTNGTFLKCLKALSQFSRLFVLTEERFCAWWWEDFKWLFKEIITIRKIFNEELHHPRTFNHSLTLSITQLLWNKILMRAEHDGNWGRSENPLRGKGWCRRNDGYEFTENSTKSDAIFATSWCD